MRVLKTELYDKGYQSLLKEVIGKLEGVRHNLLLSPSDANVLVHGYRNPGFQSILDSYAYNIPDGVPSVWVSKLKGAKEINRCAGPDFFKDVLKLTKDKPISHYFIGGRQEVLEQMVNAIKDELGNSNIAGIYSPPFKEFTQEEIEEMAKMANDSGADFIWVGLGAPKQLIFSAELAKHTNAYFVAPVGAAFDFMAGSVKKAPMWIQKNGLEWAYRLSSEPKRLGKRYLQVVPRFIWYNILESLSKH
ncbi:MAG: WecB/TagA/CpsF family glycosyltransferase [Salibacteraceae bacterium]